MKLNKKKLTIILFITIQIITYLMLSFAVLFSNTIVNTIFSTVIILLFLVSFCLLIVLYQYMLELASLKAANQVLKQHIKMRQEHLIVQEENHKRFEKIKDQFSTEIKNYINDHNDFKSEDARLLANILMKNCSALYETHFCENKVIDAIMYNKTLYASKYGIKIIPNLIVPEKIPLSSIELMSLYTNLIDNAIEYCARLPEDKKIISIHSYLKSGYLVIKVRNYRIETTPFQLNQVQTSKMDKENHGNGLNIIRYTCEKNQGMLSVSEQNHEIEFQATCQLKSDQTSSSTRFKERKQ